MRLAFYLPICPLLLGCSGGAPQPAPAVEDPFPVVPGGVLWIEPEPGTLPSRWARHLEGNSRAGLRFALTRFTDMGPDATVLLEDRIRELLIQPSLFPALHNMVEALGRARAVDAEELLLDVLSLSTVPIIRSVSIQSLVQIGAGGAALPILLHLQHEQEAGPLFAGWGAVGQLGGPEAAAQLEEKFQLWLLGDPAWTKLGSLVWQGLLQLQDEGAADRLARLTVGIAPIFQAQALRRRAELGDSRAVAEIGFLLANPVHGELVREEAIRGLVAAGAYDVLLGFPAHGPFPETSAVLQGLRQAFANGQELGADWLQEATRHPDPTLALQALQALCERGDRRLLDPWIRLARSFPLAEGSAQALHVLRYPNVGDHLLPAILEKRWSFCDPVQQEDVLRLLGELPKARGFPLIRKILTDENLEPQVRHQAHVQLGNVGPISLSVLKSLLRAKPHGQEADTLVGALSRLALEDDASREFLVAIAVTPLAGETCQRFALDSIPSILGADSMAPLMQARDQAQRGRVRAYVEWLLRTYF